MVCRTLSYEKTLVLVLLAAGMMITGCTSKSKDRSPDWSRNTAVLKAVQQVPSMEPGSQVEKEALERFEADEAVAIDNFTGGGDSGRESVVRDEVVFHDDERFFQVDALAPHAEVAGIAADLVRQRLAARVQPVLPV